MDLFCFFRERHLTTRLKQKYQATFEPENFHGNVMLISADGRILFTNNACRQLFGYSDKELNKYFLWSLASDSTEEEKIRAWFQEVSTNHPWPAPFPVNYKHADGRTVFCQMDWDYEYDGTGKIIGFLSRLTDLSEIRANEHRLLSERETNNEQMARLEKELESANSLVELLTQKKDKTREEVGTVIQQNMDQRIIPLIEQVKATRLSKNQLDLIETIEANLNAILAPFSKHETDFGETLTPMEILISDLIVKGKINKEIAEMLSISVRTVNFHRECLRQKLGIVNKKVNLRSKLMSLVQKM
jgi:PAS domain S-box-containing protein